MFIFLCVHTVLSKWYLLCLWLRKRIKIQFFTIMFICIILKLAAYLPLFLFSLRRTRTFCHIKFIRISRAFPHFSHVLNELKRRTLKGIKLCQRNYIYIFRFPSCQQARNPCLRLCVYIFMAQCKKFSVLSAYVCGNNFYSAREYYQYTSMHGNWFNKSLSGWRSRKFRCYKTTSNVLFANVFAFFDAIFNVLLFFFPNKWFDQHTETRDWEKNDSSSSRMIHNIHL